MPSIAITAGKPSVVTVQSVPSFGKLSTVTALGVPSSTGALGLSFCAPLPAAEQRLPARRGACPSVYAVDADVLPEQSSGARLEEARDISSRPDGLLAVYAAAYRRAYLKDSG